MMMRVNRTTNGLALLIVCFIVSSSIFYFLPIPREYSTDEIDELSIPDHFTLQRSIVFTARSFNQTIVIDLTCSEGYIDIVVLYPNEFGNWYTGEEYLAYYEAQNTSLVSETLVIDQPIVGWIQIMMLSSYGNVSLTGSITGYSIAYNEPLSMLSFALAIPFAIAWICYTIHLNRTDETMTLAESEMASLE
ncbi:MAG: hypothetical protein ACFFED_11755 [Candidatus Thorarchaeota archaeon]